MRHALLGMLGCVLGLTLGVGTVHADNKSGKYKATRDITVDRVTGKLRKPNAAEVEKLVADLSAMTRRPAPTGPGVELKDGGYAMSLDGGYAGVMLARPNADGTYETRCVFTFEEAAEFLGLVPDNTQ